MNNFGFIRYGQQTYQRATASGRSYSAVLNGACALTRETVRQHCRAKDCSCR